jgi:hypothetical protein
VAMRYFMRLGVSAALVGLLSAGLGGAGAGDAAAVVPGGVPRPGLAAVSKAFVQCYIGHRPAESPGRPAGTGPAHQVVADPPQACLNDVVLVSASDGWAVGQFASDNGTRSMILHWDGTRWSPWPHPGPSGSYLMSVSAVSATDVWAVGLRTMARVREHALIEHWNGTRWSVVPGPPVTPYGDNLLAVSADSPTDAWAVGVQYGDGGNDEQVNMLHWDGTLWTAVDFPVHCQGYVEITVQALEAVSPDDVWAAGRPCYSDQLLLAHWDGIAWRVAHGPPLDWGFEFSSIKSLSAVASDDIWAVGTEFSENSYARALALHYDGATWKLASAAHIPPKRGQSSLTSVTAIGHKDVWAVGFNESNLGRRALAVQHFDGTSWRYGEAPPPVRHPHGDVIAWGVASTPAGLVVSVGDYGGNYSYGDYSGSPFAERWDGSAWHPMPLDPPKGAWEREHLGGR